MHGAEFAKNGGHADGLRGGYRDIGSSIPLGNYRCSGHRRAYSPLSGDIGNTKRKSARLSFASGTQKFLPPRLLDAVGMYDASLRGYSEDFELWIRLLRSGYRLCNLPASYYLLRIRAGSASQGFNVDNDAFLRTTQATLRE